MFMLASDFWSSKNPASDKVKSVALLALYLALERTSWIGSALEVSLALSML